MQPVRAASMILLLALVALAGCSSPGSPGSSSSSSSHAAADPCAGVARPASVPSNHSAVALSTSKGCMVAELYDDKAPVTVRNFLNYTHEGFYANLTFHRVMKGFMSQTGGFRQDGTQKAPTHPPIRDEALSSGLKNLHYTLSMARTGRPDPRAPDSATSQFFVNAADNGFLDPKGPDPSNPDTAGYAVFGVLVSGKDVADAINSVPVAACPQTGEQSCPVQPPILIAVRAL